MKRLRRFLAFGMFFTVFAAHAFAVEKSAKSKTAGDEEFFIITSVDMSKNQLVLKHPTEVTELMLMSGGTACADELGKALSCKNLRAGDTVFVISQSRGSGPRTALRIHLGAMTVDEVHRRYMGQSQ